MSWLLWLLLLPAQAADAKTNGEAEPLLQQGLALVEKGDLDGAKQVFRKAIELAPEDAAFHYQLSNVYYTEKQWDEAIQSCRTARRFAPQDPALPFKIGNAYFHKGQIKQAIDFYRQAVVLKGSDPDYRVNLGVALYEAQDYQGAQAQFHVARFQTPRDPQILLYLGNALARLSKYDEAIDTYQEALKVNPKERQAYYNLGFAYVQKARLRAEPTTVSRYINETTKNQYYLLGTKYYPMDMYRRAADYLTRYQALMPADEETSKVAAMIAKLKALAGKPQS